MAYPYINYEEELIAEENTQSEKTYARLGSRKG